MPYTAAPDRYRHMQLPAQRPQRAAAAGDLARALAQLRRRPAARDEPRDPPARVRPRRHALRPGEQLRAAVRLGRGDVRPGVPGRPSALPRRARDLDEGRLRHVARAVRRMGLAQVPARVARPVARADGARLRRHLLLAPLRSRDAARGDDGRARHRGALGQGAVRGHLVVLAREDARGGRDPARARHAAAHPPAVVLAAQPLDRAGAARRRSASSGSAASASRRSRRGCSPTSTSTGSRRDSRAAENTLALARPADRRDARRRSAR